MAKFSDALGKWVAGTDRTCWRCKQPIKNLDRDLGEYRRVWPGGRTELLCMTCHLTRSQWLGSKTPPLYVDLGSST